jgi:hypothetical protein
MVMSRVMYGVCVGDWGRFSTYVAPRTAGRDVIAMSGQTSIAAAYRAIASVAEVRGAEALILLHDDLELLDPQAEEKILGAIRSGSDLVGMAGGGSAAGIGWWAQSPVGATRCDDPGSPVVDFGQRSGDVETLDGALLAMSSWAVRHTYFDTRYPGFHGYDADISAQVRRGRRRVSVIDIDTHHHTRLGFKSAESEADWWTADAIFREKWGLNA